MNILYISKLDGRPWIGPTYSVPKQIQHQSIYDNVFWYNLYKNHNNPGRDNVDNWRKLNIYHDLENYPEKKISKLPEPFNKPDLILVEQAYPFSFEPIKCEILKLKIPYIVIPRGELTSKAQSKHKLKKKIGNHLIRFYKFIKDAVAIQYLTKNEQENSGLKWNDKGIVIPNGIELLKNNNKEFSKDGIRCVFIGRIEPFQKGIDLLIEACLKVKKELINSNCSIDIYGSYFVEVLNTLKQQVKSKNLDSIIHFHDAVYGDEKKNILNESDIFLIPSRFEGHPMGLLEALSYGLPCVATEGCNMRNEIDEYDAGWTANNDIDSLAQALLLMTKEQSLFNRKHYNALLLAKNYDWDSIARKTHIEYQKIFLNEEED